MMGDEQIKVLVRQATEAANTVITTYTDALNGASTALRAGLPELSRSFSALPQPGATSPVDQTPAPTTVGASGASSQVDAWLGEATRTLVASGVSASQLSPQDLALIIQHESNGDPSAINNWDGNAAAGTPSIGLMQTIEPTLQRVCAGGPWRHQESGRQHYRCHALRTGTLRLPRQRARCRSRPQWSAVRRLLDRRHRPTVKDGEAPNGRDSRRPR
jgi:Transglycosylase SLT domain